MATEKQELFREESSRRFGSLDDYVAEKIKDEFPIKGNIRVNEYVKNYLEFIFKKYCINNVLDEEERQALGDSDGFVAEYFKNMTWGTEVLKDQIKHAESLGLTGVQSEEEIEKRSKGMGRTIRTELKLSYKKRKILENKDKFFASIDEIAIMDVGPAIGAISTMFTLKTLNAYGLLDRTKIYLVDISEDVLDSNIKGDFPNPPEEFINEHFGSISYFNKLKNCLSNAIPLKNAVDDRLNLPDNSIDISIASFLLHHIPNESKQKAADEIIRVTKGGIFVADEYFKDYEKDFAVHHQEDQIDLAPEEPIEFPASLCLFPKEETIWKEGIIMGSCYAYSLVKA